MYLSTSLVIHYVTNKGDISTVAVLAISLRMYYQLKRNPYTFAVLIFLPVIMVFMFFIAFSSLNSAGNTTYSIIVVNNDKGLDDNVAESFKVLSNVIGINLGDNTNNTVDKGF